jgi:hypothetical protein
VDLLIAERPEVGEHTMSGDAVTTTVALDQLSVATALAGGG